MNGLLMCSSRLLLLEDFRQHRIHLSDPLLHPLSLFAKNLKQRVIFKLLLIRIFSLLQ